MINTTTFLEDLFNKREAYQTGVHHILVRDYNRYVYPIAFILGFGILNAIINKIVYYKTDTYQFYSLCIKKYNLKQTQKHSKRINELNIGASGRGDEISSVIACR